MGSAEGLYRLQLLPIGTYRVTVNAAGFGSAVREAIDVTVGQTIRLDLRLEVSAVVENVTVAGGAPLVDTSTNALGRVITGRELVDLPLNGRNFTQLGLLQTGVAPLTAGVATAGGSMRQGQAYAVNGMRPEQNIYLVDGAQNMNRMDGGYAVKIPVDAIAEFRILTQSAPPEYGGTGGATTSVVTRGGGNQFHGSAYEFLRNDAFDARNFFSREVEPLDQHQFGATVGGPLRVNRSFFFGYYEGFRNEQGVTTSATVPTAQERQGDFSGMTGPLLNLAAGGVPFPGNQIPQAAIHPVARNVVNLYPLGNVSPSIYRDTLVGENRLNQAGTRFDFNASSNDQLFGRYSYSGGHNLNPISVRGTDVPGYPTRDDLATHSALVSATRIMGASLTNSVRATFLRHKFLFDQRLNRQPPSELGFGYSSANEIGQGPPFFNISGYTPIGGAITGPRNSTQTTFEVQDGLSWTRGRHLVKVGGELRRTGIDMVQAIAPNAFFVFAGTFPTNNAIANLLLASPVTFYQGLGDFNRGVRLWNFGSYVQDEWRAGRSLTVNYGVRYERINPFTEIEDRLNTFVPGVQSTVRPDAPKGLLFPGDPGVGKGIAQSANAFMPRVGIAWDPAGDGRWSVRSSYGLFYEQFQNGAGHDVAGGDQRDSGGAVQPVQRRRAQLRQPLPGPRVSGPQHLRPSVDGVRDGRRREAALHAELERRRAAVTRQPVSRRSAVRRRERVAAAAQRRDEPGGLRAGRDRAERRPPAPLRELPGRRRHLRFLDHRDAAEHHPVELPFAAAERVAPVRRRPRLQRVVLAGAGEGRAVGDEPVRSRGEAAGRRERPRAESLRCRRGVWAVAVRRAPPLRGQRQLGATSRPIGAGRAAGAAPGLAAERHRVAQLRHAVHGVRLDQRLAAGQQPADFRLRRQPAEPGRRSQRRPAHRGRLDRPIGASSGSIP